MAKTLRIRPIDQLARVRGMRMRGMPAEIGAGRKRVPDLGPVQVAGRAVSPEPRLDQPCNTKGNRPLRRCHIELALLGAKHAAPYGVPAGAYLRVCTEVGGAGTLIPIADHRDADRLSAAFCACRQKGGTAVSCAKKIR